MSIPENPLNVGITSTHRHILVAFKFAEDAFNTTSFDMQGALVGKPAPGASGPNIVVVNEMIDQTYTIPQAIWDFDFAPNIGVSTSTSVGKIVIEDKIVPYGFLNFLHEKVLSYFVGLGPMSLSHATFMLKTVFETDDASLIMPEPYYFNIDSIESLTQTIRTAPTRHVLYTIGAANTLGVLRSFSSLFQMNITHKDGNLHDTIPEGDGTILSLDTRAIENAANTSKRKDRADLSKPMTTLKDIFEGLEADLNQLKYANKAQLQQWMREVRTDSVDKIIVVPKQTKKPDPDQLPIDYVIDLDPKYQSYSIDNRNMPFEQPDVLQDNKGVRVFPERTGTVIIELISSIMMLSKQVGEDAIDDKPKTFKTTITATRKTSDRYEVNIKIRKYDIPRDDIIHKAEPGHTVKDTGPGVNPSSTSLHFFVNAPEPRDQDVLEFNSHLNYTVNDKMLEKQSDAEGAGIVYADREQGTAERRPSLSFFETMYSGVRSMIGSYTNDGLESAQRGGDILNLMDRYTYLQTTDYIMSIHGNPYLLSDVNRNPSDVVADSDGVKHYYSKPETNPMYLKLTIYLKSMAADDNPIPERFYYDDYYHITRVINIFGVVGGPRAFTQNLLLKRNDDLI